MSAKIVSVKSGLILLGAVLLGLMIALVLNLNWVVRHEDAEGVVHMRYSRLAPASIAVLAACLAGLLLRYADRGAQIIFIPMVLLLGGFLSHVLWSESATIDEQRCVFTTTSGKEHSFRFEDVKRIIVVTEKNYRVRRHGAIDTSKYVEVYYTSGGKSRFPTGSPLARTAYEEGLTRIGNPDVPITTRKAGGAR